MASDNRISVEISAAQKTAIVDAVTALKTALQGITINLTKFKTWEGTNGAAVFEGPKVEAIAWAVLQLKFNIEGN